MDIHTRMTTRTWTQKMLIEFRYSKKVEKRFFFVSSHHLFPFFEKRKGIYLSGKRKKRGRRIHEIFRVSFLNIHGEVSVGLRVIFKIYIFQVDQNVIFIFVVDNFWIAPPTFEICAFKDKQVERG